MGTRILRRRLRRRSKPGPVAAALVGAPAEGADPDALAGGPGEGRPTPTVVTDRLDWADAGIGAGASAAALAVAVAAARMRWSGSEEPLDAAPEGS